MKAIQIQGGSNPIKTTKYVNFKGVDMTTDPAKVDNSRSPFAPNLIADSGGFPEKRLGWRTLQTIEAPINGLFYTVINNQTMFVAHGGTKLYKWEQDTSPIVIKENVSDSKSVAFSQNKKLWILTGNEYLVFDGETVNDVCETAYIPTTVIARAATGGGEPYESVNLLQAKRINKFLADGTSLIYQLDTNDIDVEQIEIKINDVQKSENTDFTVDRATGKITFTNAPEKPVIIGQDNVIITFSKTVAEYKERITQCTIVTMYGIGTNDRIFFSGNVKHRSTDWHSGLSDPAYVPDINYSLIGNENTAIMGYSRIGEYLAIIKEDNSQDSTIFLRSAKLEQGLYSTEQKAAFPLKQGVTGVGSISKYGLANLLDEPLFLSRTGIYGVTSNTITAERTVQNRSYFVDPQLTKETNLEDAICTEWNGLFICCINSRCYILDGKQDKTYKAESNGNYVYECYHWDNVPAICFMEHQGNLYFGTASGKICRFNNDLKLTEKYNDDENPIVCYWSTKADDDGDFMLRKSIVKKGSGLMIKPYTRSSCKVIIRTDNNFGREIRKAATMDIFDFNDIDFTRFSFNTNDGPQVVPFNARIKKYITAQIIVKNDVKNEGFGVFGIIKRFTVGNYVK